MSGTALIALVGNPNSGKSALFNTLTGLRQKVANYPGATVEKKVGTLLGNDGEIEIVDLPGTYSLNPKSADEEVTVRVLEGRQAGLRSPDAIVCVIDATNLARHIPLALELKGLGLPMIVALNMMDMAERDGIIIDVPRLSEELGVPVIETVAVRSRLVCNLAASIQTITTSMAPAPCEATNLRDRQRLARVIANSASRSEGFGNQTTRLLDKFLLNAWSGLPLLVILFFVMFQAVFSWASPAADLLEESIGVLQVTVAGSLPDAWYTSLINDGILAGVGAVVVFFPQIIILFTFILIMEGSGYMARAAFLMDKLMARVGLNGRAFIPLLSSFACAIPGIMAARSIASEKDRLTTILIAPLMTCSARLPVYTLIIAAFIPETSVGLFNLQGLVMFGLYMVGIISALIIAFVFRRTLTKGTTHPLLMELPKYQMPTLSYLGIGLYERAKVFVRRAGTIILASTVILWLLALWPVAPPGSGQPDIYYSLVGIIGRGLAVIFEPIGFSWDISIALVPGMAAREVAVAALGTVYALSGNEEAVEAGLQTLLPATWSLPTALSFLAWFVFAPQCLSTIAVTRRETGGWRWPAFMLAYLFGLAYIASFITFQVATIIMS